MRKDYFPFTQKRPDRWMQGKQVSFTDEQNEHGPHRGFKLVWQCTQIIFTLLCLCPVCALQSFTFFLLFFWVLFKKKKSDVISTLQKKNSINGLAWAKTALTWQLYHTPAATVGNHSVFLKLSFYCECFRTVQSLKKKKKDHVKKSKGLLGTDYRGLLSCVLIAHCSLL